MAIPQLPEPTLNQNNEPTLSENNEPTLKKLRLWPGVVAAVLVVLGWFVVPFIMPEGILYGMLGGAIAVLAIFVWWVFFSRAPWVERLGVIVLVVIALFVTSRLIHISILGGAMGYLFPVMAIPFLSLALVAAVVASRRSSAGVRRLAIAIGFLVVCVGFTLFRTGGITAYGGGDWHWRWSRTPEEQLLAQGDEPPTPATAPGSSAAPTAASASTDWPGFRGAQRDGIVHGTQIKTDWSASPPVEMWRRPIGPGWSSFAVQGDLVYTQEQRGNDEVVACYHLSTGKPAWRHSDAARFWESNAGAGPRGTPTLSNGRVYTLGATGIVNVLDAIKGNVIWSRNAATDTKKKIPTWGFAASPLIVGDVVIIATAGALVAYDLATGEPRWLGPDGGGGYSSPHLVTIQGVPQVLLLSMTGATSVSPTDGKVLWQQQSPGARIVQPAVTADGDILLHDGEGNAMHRIALANGPGGWTVQERWESFGVNPYFSDFVVHKGYAYGFSGNSIACSDLKDGERKWKGGSYGSGQLVLLADQDLLLVLTEQGELALVGATPEQFKELARFPAIKGKTWNHPVLAGDVVLVRNGEEMAAFRLARGQ